MRIIAHGATQGHAQDFRQGGEIFQVQSAQKYKCWNKRGRTKNIKRGTKEQYNGNYNRNIESAKNKQKKLGVSYIH